MAEIKFEITDKHGVIGEGSKGGNRQKNWFVNFERLEKRT